MAEVNTFKMGNTSITVTDTTARNNAATALQTATEAKSTAGPFNVKYDSGTKTITFTQITK